ncbi:MAG: hypothetical protein V4585_04235 [Bacteroidota bacterium]
MKTLSEFLNRNANWKTLLVFLVIYVSFPAYFLKNAESKINELAGKTLGVIDLTFGFNPQKTLDMVKNYGEEARRFYATTELTTDIIYPLVYAFLLGIILTLLYRNKLYKPFESVNILPFFCQIFDYLENNCIVYLLKSFPEQSSTIATFCELFKLLKWLSFGLIIIFILYGLIRLLLEKLKINRI